MLLNVHSYYSLRYGTISEKELLEMAAARGYTQMVLTDINNTSACLNFIRLAPQFGIRPMVGIDFRNGNQRLYVGLAQNNTGFMQLNRFLSVCKARKEPFPETAPALEGVYMIYPFERALELDKQSLAPYEYIGVQWQELRKIRFSRLYAQKECFVILQPVSFRGKRDFNLHRLLRAIDNNTLLSKLPPEEQSDPDALMLPKAELLDKFTDFPDLVIHTEKLLAQCSIRFDFSQGRKPQNKMDYTGNSQADKRMIRELCEKGLAYRYSEPSAVVRSRMEKELALIEEMGFIPFFLINWDIVDYAKRQGYYHVGRGSGANSIVAYLLGITDVDPIELDLYFERFMNLYRANPPDFDIDFSWRDREDVTRYIFERFGGQGQVALLATYNTFKHSAAVRELGKVFGLPKHEIDRLSSGKYDPTQLDKLSALTHRYAGYMQGMPNYLSVHSGGILISEKPIHYFSATDLPPKGFPTTQFDMVIAEDVGLYKYDILAQRGLGKIKDALALVRENRPHVVLPDIHHVAPLIQDPKINAMVARAACVGCFYVESPAMRMLLKKLEVDNYLGLVAASSIIRPGVSQSGMMREYILRHKDPERRKLAHPVLWDIMPDTYGVMVYQEDVIKVAHHFAGLDLGEADVLRRGMSGKYRSRDEFLKVKQKFFANCNEKGHDPNQVAEIWRQIESFAGYAFAKGHSASYAVESYQSLYLKCYYPLEYMVATLNNGGGYYKAEFYIHEARMCGGHIHLPHINKSDYLTRLEGNHIYLGFCYLQNFELAQAKRIMEVRQQDGAFGSLDDFLERVPIGMEQLEVLIRIDAFRELHPNKRKLLWQAYLKRNKIPQHHQQPLFRSHSRNFALPELQLHKLEQAFDELELLGFALGDPFDLLERPPATDWNAVHMKRFLHRNMELYGYLVSLKKTKTSGGKLMFFGTFLDRQGAWIDTVHFPPVAKKYPFRGRGIYRLRGKVMEEFGFLTLEVNHMEKMAYVEDRRYKVLD